MQEGNRTERQKKKKKKRKEVRLCVGVGRIPIKCFFLFFYFVGENYQIGNSNQSFFPHPLRLFALTRRIPRVPALTFAASLLKKKIKKIREACCCCCYCSPTLFWYLWDFSTLDPYWDSTKRANLKKRGGGEGRGEEKRVVRLWFVFLLLCQDLLMKDTFSLTTW